MTMVRSLLAITLVHFLSWASNLTTMSQETRTGLTPLSDVQAQEILHLDATLLPNWALILAEPLPNATVALLQLDALHRSANPIGNVLAAKIRWVVADALHCDFQAAYAEADLERLGVSRIDIETFKTSGDAIDQDDQEVAAFSRKLTEAAYSLTDQEVAHLVDRFGPEKVAGIVHTVAFANFQCRLVQGLQCELGSSRPLPPIEQEVDANRPNDLRAPPRTDFASSVKDKYLTRVRFPSEWNNFDSNLILHGLAKQQARPGRVAIPEDEQLKHLTAEELMRSGRVIWSRVSLGYQPKLTRGWFRLMGAFHADSEMDPVFCNSMFLVVTRSNECFY